MSSVGQLNYLLKILTLVCWGSWNGQL